MIEYSLVLPFKIDLDHKGGFSKGSVISYWFHIKKYGKVLHQFPARSNGLVVSKDTDEWMKLTKKFNEKVKKVWGLDEWKGIDDPDQDVLFFGLYIDQDYNVFYFHEGKKSVF